MFCAIVNKLKKWTTVFAIVVRSIGVFTWYDSADEGLRPQQVVVCDRDPTI